MKRVVVFFTLVSIIAFVSISFSLYAVEYKKVKIVKKKLNLSSLKLEECDEAIEFKKNLYLINCQNSNKDNEDNYGFRTYLVSYENGNPNIIYESHGAMDAYYALFDVYKVNENVPYVILAEQGAEESWGIKVYLFEKSKMKGIGFMNVAMEFKDVSGVILESAVPCIGISRKGSDISFKFNKDIVFMKGRKFTNIEKNKLEYILSGNKLIPKFSK